MDTLDFQLHEPRNWLCWFRLASGTRHKAKRFAVLSAQLSPTAVDTQERLAQIAEDPAARSVRIAYGPLSAAGETAIVESGSGI